MLPPTCTTADDDKIKSKSFCEDMIKQSEVDETLGHYLVFNNEVTFDLSGKVKKKCLHPRN
jgi:hypothetical protein